MNDAELTKLAARVKELEDLVQELRGNQQATACAVEDLNDRVEVLEKR